MTELTDGVIGLRPLRPDDAPAIYEACIDPLTQRFTVSLPDPYRPEDAREFVELAAEWAAAGEEQAFAIVEPPADEWVGTISIRFGERASVGYMVAPRARGRGVATRALVLAAGWAISERGVERLELTTHVDNVASQRVAEKAGFVREGMLRAYLKSRRDGRRRDSVMFSLLPGELR
jgi:RimJ/RimL family protein N-acetyltransferase